MASWTDQDTDSLLPGEPWTSAKALAAFENPVAIAEGAAGAPKIQAEALGPQEVNENAMRVQEFSASGSLSGSGTAIVTIAGNLVFFPRVSGNDIEGVMSGGQLLVRNRSNDDTRNYTVSWYRIVP
ncbi:MAG TPA: hypothetical protein VGP45_02285 [Marinobacter sp.]|nr:hypothetical protein [Marinobacter sp.]